VERAYRIEWFSKPLSQQWGVGKFQRQLRRLHDRWPFEVIHTFSSYPTGFAALDLMYERSVPPVVTSQGGDLAVGSRYEQRPAIMDRIRRTLLEASAVTAISQYMHERALAIEPRCAPQLVDIPNGVDVAALSAPVAEPVEFLKQHPFLQTNPFILFLGRLHPRKGIDVLVRAFDQVAEEHAGVRLVIAGQGREREMLEGLVGASAARDRIHLIGAVHGEAKRWLLHRALFVTAPTRTWEGMPVVVLEAMACGQPVVGTRVGGIVDLVHDGRDGVLAEPDDVASLAAGLQRMIGDPALREQLARGARETIAPYDWRIVAEQYLDLFRKLVAREPVPLT